MLANPCVISETSAFTSITNGLDNKFNIQYINLEIFDEFGRETSAQYRFT